MGGRGPSMARQVDIAFHFRQVAPVMLAFDNWRAFQAHLKALDDEVSVIVAAAKDQTTK